MTKAQQTFERINALVDGGTQKAEAFKQLAEEYGQPVDSVRGAYYGHKRAAEGGSSGTTRRSRKRETTLQDAVASAVATLEAAVNSIEAELETARQRAEEAQAEYQAMRSASGGRIEDIRAKIAVLDPEASDQSPQPATTTPDAKSPTTTAGTPGAKPTAPRKEVKGS